MRTSDKLCVHVVAFNVPYPPDYGGVIDVYYKLLALHKAGVEITLHCFEYGRGERPALLSVCKEVYYYKRRKMWRGVFDSRPLIVSSRQSKVLLSRLQKDNAPILYEGLHCCSMLSLLAKNNRNQLVRLHNNEPQYYEALAIRETNLFKKWYYRVESKRLARFENILKSASTLLTIAPQEQVWYSSKFKHSVYTGPFHQNTTVQTTAGQGEYILYHGNLSVNENIQAVTFLIREVFPFINYPVIISGHQPPASLRKMISNCPNVTLQADPGQEELSTLIRNAHIHTLVTFQSTGIKLKLINSLYNGRFCLANSEMIAHTGLEHLVIQADSASEMIAALEQTMRIPFSEEDVLKRKEMERLVSNERAAELILQCLP